MVRSSFQTAVPGSPPSSSVDRGPSRGQIDVGLLRNALRNAHSLHSQGFLLDCPDVRDFRSIRVVIEKDLFEDSKRTAADRLAQWSEGMKSLTRPCWIMGRLILKELGLLFGITLRRVTLIVPFLKRSFSGLFASAKVARPGLHS